MNASLLYVMAHVAATQARIVDMASCPSIAAMRVTTFTDYAFRVLMYLALQGERRATVDEIAHAYGISVNHLTKVVHQLGRSGWVQTVRGKGGGLQLGQPAAQIRLGDVARLCEGDTTFAACMVNDMKHCRIASACRLAGILDRAFRTFYAELNEHTLADLVRDPAALRERLAVD
ncbi:MAG TPA: Rrf2 family transcriptional regulator [Ottowia sp.]|uniref:Rrf2 family transcriptional regulator n=1 Tax=Ottowia sp. TaxID=1898956 RepID=UPI002CC678A3|nr:Rrf2 family transcriptional regulator [Ottowia sp.]HMN20740.1 Rrf2 family transcriptional regulator [Ottowia sp.]